MRITYNGDVMFDDSMIRENNLTVKRYDVRFDYYANGSLSEDYYALATGTIVIMVEGGDVEHSYYYRSKWVNYYECSNRMFYYVNKLFDLNALAFYQRHRIKRTEKRPQLC